MARYAPRGETSAGLTRSGLLRSLEPGVIVHGHVAARTCAAVDRMKQEQRPAPLSPRAWSTTDATLAEHDARSASAQGGRELLVAAPTRS